jgi:glycosyltransferase involved in cell wall biosynthesis
VSTPHVVHVVESLVPSATAGQLDAVRSLATDGIRHSVVVRRRGLAIFAAWQAIREIAAREPDVIHLWDDWALGDIGPMVTLGPSSPPVIASLRHPRAPGTWRAARKERAMIKRVTRIVVGDESLPAVRTAGAVAASDPRLVVIRDGVERSTPEDVRRRRSEVRAELRLPAASRLIGYAGPLVPHANVRDVIWLGMLLRVLHPEVRVVVVGEGPHVEDLRRFATLVEYAEQTLFLGARPDETRIVGACDLYVDGARLDGPSSALDAAQAAGVPVLCVNTPIRRRQIDAERTGYLVAEHDQATLVRRAHKLLSDSDLHRTMSAAARAWSERLPTPAATAARYAELYHSVK